MMAVSQHHLLIVDDEASIRSTVARILQGIGCVVSTAANGEEALRRLEAQEKRYDLILLDLRMPDMDGITLLNQIRKNHARIPVILLTAHGSFSSAVDALHLGAIDYLLKPIDPEALIERIQRALHQIALEKKRRQIQEQVAFLQKELMLIEHQINRIGSTDKENQIATSEILSQETIDATQPETGRFLFLGNLMLDIQTRRVTHNLSDGNSTTLILSPTSFDYLLVMARHAPNTVSYQNLVAQAQGYQTKPAEARNLAKWHIHHLRQSLERNAGTSTHIINVRGNGYRLVID